MFRTMTMSQQEADGKIGAPLLKLKMTVARKRKTEAKILPESIARERGAERAWKKTSLVHIKVAGKAILGRNTCTVIS